MSGRSISDPRRLSQLPSGTVTFLFTDIQGSTILLQALGDSYPNVLAEHHAIVRASLELHDGVEVETAGDSFFAVFRSPAAAVNAVTDMQRDLAEHSWPAGHELRVRMGLHTGEGRVGDDGYVGIDVHEAARIGDAAHGGQVVLSDATKVLLHDELSDEFTVRDLGRHRLKDLERPVRLWQLVASGIPSEFPPLRTLPRPAALPVRLTSLVGRVHDVEELKVLLATHRLITLTGAGGSGKTRLALAAAASMENDRVDGAAFVDLSAIVDFELVPSAIAASLEVAAHPGESVLDAIRRQLGESDLLLVLDNFEQVIGAAPVVSDLLRASPRSAVLVTSRAPLRVEGEQEWPVAPLPLPESLDQLSASRSLDYAAIELFVLRAQAVQPSFALTDENVAAVAEICRRLDGMPLAIELATARIRSMSPEMIASHLASTIDLATGARDVTDRQRSLRNTITWSVDLLDASDRMLFRRLAIFRGGWTLEACDEILEAIEKTSVIDGLEHLVESSLIRGDATGKGRGFMLETVRELASEQLDASGERDRIASSHAEYFLRLAEGAAPRINGPDRDATMARLGVEEDNLRSAIDWATKTARLDLAIRIVVSLGSFWHLRNQMAEGRARLEGLLARDLSIVDPRVTAAAYAVLAEMAGWQADFQTSAQMTARSLELYRAAGDDSGIADLTTFMGYALAFRDPEAALLSFNEALAILEGIDAPLTVGRAQLGAAGAYMRLGQVAEGESALGKAVEALESIGERHMLVYAYLTKGRICYLRGEAAGIRPWYAKALRLAATAGTGDAIATSLDAIADHLLDEEPVKGLRLGAAADRLRKSIGGAPDLRMIGLEPPLERGARLLDPADYAEAVREGNALTVDDAISEALRAIQAEDS